MKCPTCVSVMLVMSERQGVEIDYCPQCRGVWLDRGELDKLLERAAAQASAQLPSQVPQQRSERHQDSSYPSRQYEQPYAGHKKHYHHKSWLSEIFD
jgi:Zn-finger nucleic acid-binding protein